MTAEQLLPLIKGSLMTKGSAARELSRGYCCDLLSWVMAHAAPGMAWVTVQTHMNVIAVASLMEMGCVILPEDIRMEQAVLDKADEEGIPVISSPLNGFALCALMAANGIPG